MRALKAASILSGYSHRSITPIATKRLGLCCYRLNVSVSLWTALPFFSPNMTVFLTASDGFDTELPIFFSAPPPPIAGSLCVECQGADQTTRNEANLLFTASTKFKISITFDPTAVPGGVLGVVRGDPWCVLMRWDCDYYCKCDSNSYVTATGLWVWLTVSNSFDKFCEAM